VATVFCRDASERSDPARVVDGSHLLTEDLAAAKAAFLRALDAATGRVHAIVALPKTGSTTIAAALQRAGLASLVRTHTLRPADLAVREARYRDDPVHSRRIWHAQWLSANPPSERRPWVVASAVRDPIARRVSAYFQAISAFDHAEPDQSVESIVEALTLRFEQDLARGAEQVDWFDINLKHSTGVDVYEQPFDHSLGYLRTQGDHVDVLVVRTERIDRATAALGAMFDVPVPATIRTENAAGRKDYARRYRQVLGEFRPPADMVAQVYQDRLARHFFTQEERAALRRHWTRGRDATAGDL
jgi:hypothetical protein